MSLTLPELLMRLTLVPVVAAGAVGCLRYRHLPLNLRWLVGLIGFVLPLNVLGVVLLLQQRNNLFLMPVYAAGEFTLLVLVYERTLHSRTFTRLAPLLAGGFGLYVLLDSVYAAELTRFRPGQQVLQGGLTLLLVGVYFRQLLHELQVQQLQREPMFWVSAGLFIYYLGYLQIALFSNYLLRYSDELNMSIWAIHSCLFMVRYGCYGWALALRPRS